MQISCQHINLLFLLSFIIIDKALLQNAMQNENHFAKNAQTLENSLALQMRKISSEKKSFIFTLMFK
jgi:hypothetical protein